MFSRVSLIFFLSWSLFASEFSLLTLVVGEEYAVAVEKGTLTKSLYCSRYGYDFHCVTTSLVPQRHIVWSKIPALLKLMENPSCKWIFWNDADSLIMNHHIQLETLADNKYCLIISKEKSGTINFGQFLIKNCERSRQFLRAVYNHTEFLDSAFREQSAVMWELENNPRFEKKFVKFIPQSSINSHKSKFRSGDFILHFYGSTSLEQLSNLCELYFKQVLW
jgi:hypothetical protein